MRILLVEDDRLLGQGVESGLVQEGHEVGWVTSAEEAEPLLKEGGWEILVLDQTLPGRSGLELLTQLRSEGNGIPVLILTARDGVADRVRGLDAGADDYLVKPFDLDELAARLRALGRRHHGWLPVPLQVGDISLDPINRLVTSHGQLVDLSPREFTILHLLMESCGQVVSKTRLEQALYGSDSEVDSNTVEVFIHHLRRKLGGEVIRTVRGVGYLVPRL